MITMTRMVRIFPRTLSGFGGSVADSVRDIGSGAFIFYWPGASVWVDSAAARMRFQS
jgi:hypothetical protein